MCEFESEKEERTNKCRIDCNIVLKFKKKCTIKAKNTEIKIPIQKTLQCSIRIPYLYRIHCIHRTCFGDDMFDKYLLPFC